MPKFYRVKQDTFMWKEGAIISDKNPGQYSSVEDIWDVCPPVSSEYISPAIIEHPDNENFFERVYPDTISGKLFRTKDQLVTLYETAFK